MMTLLGGVLNCSCQPIKSGTFELFAKWVVTTGIENQDIQFGAFVIQLDIR